MSCLHRPSSSLWSNQTQTERTPRLASLLWCLAQTVGISPQEMVRLNISFTWNSWAPASWALPVCLSACRQHGHCGVGVGPAEDERKGGAGTDVSRALLSVGSQTAPFGAVHGKRQAVPVVPCWMCLCTSPNWRLACCRHHIFEAESWHLFLDNFYLALKVDRDSIAQDFSVFTMSLFLLFRWIPGPGAEVALQWRLADAHWEGAALFVLHGGWAAGRMKRISWLLL